jgi:hypothetical protein
MAFMDCIEFEEGGDDHQTLKSWVRDSNRPSKGTGLSRSNQDGNRTIEGSSPLTDAKLCHTTVK